MPPASAVREKEIIQLVQKSGPPKSKLAAVSFGENAVLEHAPQNGLFSGFGAKINGDASNLAQAIDLALTCIPEGSPGRILLISDGKYTGTDPLVPGSRAAMRNISIDYRLLERAAAQDTAIFRIDAPQEVDRDDGFMITAWIQSPLRQDIKYELRRQGAVIAAGSKSVDEGMNRLVFRDKAHEPGTIQYVLSVVSTVTDTVPENNVGRALVGVRGAKKLLCVSESDDSSLARILRANGIDVKSLKPEQCTWSLEELSNYAALILEDVSSHRIGSTAMENLAEWVRQTGSGLMFTGGKHAYGPGGYFKSPLEPIMPVSMELRREHRKLATAIVVAMDRSGSMSVSVPGGKTKMDMANLSAVQMLAMLAPVDEFGVVAVDSSSHIIVGLDQVDNHKGARSDILRIESMGGGIFIYEALSTAAKMLLTAKAQNRHIILFADAADSEEPGKYQELLAKCAEAGITVSVIGLGRETDQDAQLLREIADLGKGQIFFTDDAMDLPRLFAQDTFIVARSAFIEGPVNIKCTAAMMSLAGRTFDFTAALGGYNLCYLRSGANPAVLTIDEYEAPIVAAWQAGVGRVLCYTGQAGGNFTGAIGDWGDYQTFLSSLVRWTAGQESGSDNDFVFTQRLENGLYKIQLHLDPDRKTEMIHELPAVTMLHGVAGQKPAVQKVTMAFTDADTLAVELPITGTETVLSSVACNGKSYAISPVCLPYSSEFKPTVITQGGDVLRKLAQLTHGRELVNLGDIWKEMPKVPRLFSISPVLLIFAIVLILIEVLERRTGLLSKQHLRVSQIRFERRDAAKLKDTVLGKSITKQPPDSGTEKTVKPQTSADYGGSQARMAETLSAARRKANEFLRK